MKYYVRNPCSIAGVYYMDSLVYGQLDLLEVFLDRIQFSFDVRKLGYPIYGAMDEVPFI